MLRLTAVGIVLGMVALAQTDRGTLTGVITDPAGAVVANAAIELRGVETGMVYPAVTSATGNYTFSQLPVGTYELTVAIPGFKKLTRGNIRVQSSQVIPLDLQLEVGSPANR
jgi:Carboxypeptidase regulatory-like domain